ncbi:hypothetical protein D5S17_21825 [Pseudonocardiaceae bacterium YIM PH 21723]|nr:hypothetical protein D5S17_21825 [Pseudonocardiaceae bacterium YIM PH 21723]
MLIWVAGVLVLCIGMIVVFGSTTSDRARAAQAAAPQAKLGIQVYDRQAGKTLTELNADQQFNAESVVKLLIAMDWAERNGRPTGGSIAQMLSTSDDKIANKLWTEGGGNAIIQRMVSACGLRNTTPPERAGFWGDTRTTAADQVAVYKYLLGRPYAPVLLRAMRASTEVAADGFDQSFGLPDAAPGSAVKQGWGHDYLHSTGIVGDRYIVIILTKGTKAPKQITAVAGEILPATAAPW